ncbi:hypothetical protein Hanom_Chr11g01014501 [Helianthus anomalus]
MCKKRLVMVHKSTFFGFLVVIAENEYFHRAISFSMTTRGKSREWCTSVDLFFLYCLLYKRLCALAHG